VQLFQGYFSVSPPETETMKQNPISRFSAGLRVSWAVKQIASPSNSWPGRSI
jgi:hypothetical protein